MPVPSFLNDISVDVRAGRRRRLKVRTLMANYGLKRRRSESLAVIRADLNALGISTVPDFEITPFDDQVSFVVAGDKAGAENDGNHADATEFYRIEAQPGKVRSYRVVLRTYDAFERFQQNMVGSRSARLFRSGQNPRRDDRDAFPFYLNLSLADQYDLPDLDRWLCEASTLEYEEEPGGPQTTSPTIAASDDADLRMREHISDLYEGLRSDMAARLDALRWTMEQKVDEIRFDAIQKLAKEINDEEAMKIIADFDREMRGKLEQKEAELKDKQKENNLLHSQLADISDVLQDAESPEVIDASDAYPTMAAAVRLFQDLCQDSAVLVHERAIQSAQKSSSIRRREVLLFLLTLRDLADALYKRGQSGQTLKQWFEDRGYEYAQGDSQTAANQFGKERQIKIDGEVCQLEEHVTLFPNTPNCVSVYFLRDNSTNMLIVGYVGAHLRTAGFR